MLRPTFADGTPSKSEAPGRDLLGGFNFIKGEAIDTLSALVVEHTHELEDSVC